MLPSKTHIQNTDQMRFRDLLLFVVLVIVWGSAFTAIKAGLKFFPPVLFAAFRYDLAEIVMLGYAAYVTDRWRPRADAIGSSSLSAVRS